MVPLDVIQVENTVLLLHSARIMGGYIEQKPSGELFQL